MFAQKNRLNRAAFTDTYTRGRRVHTPGLLLVYLNTPMRNVAVVVGKKVAKSAVARNRLKRQLYAALYEINMISGHVVVVAKPAARAYSYARLKTEIITALDRVGVPAHSR